MTMGYQATGTPVLVGGPTNQQAPVENPQQRVRPFRQATLEKNETQRTDIIALTTAYQPEPNPVTGSGYIFGFSLEFAAVVPSNNSANVAYVEDGAYSVNGNTLFQDVTGPLVNLPGWSLRWISRYGGWEFQNDESSTDGNIYSKVTGTGATGGNFVFHQRVPVSTGRRTLLAMLGNQDRSQSYQLSNDLAPSTAVYSTSPTALPNITITRSYQSYEVPNQANADGSSNQVEPPLYGVLHYLLQSVNANVPVGGSTIPHYLQGLGNTIRVLMLVFRSNSSRATAESNMPTQIQVKIANQLIFNETLAARRKMMYDRYGFDAPSGVLVYDNIHDLIARSTSELGHDLWWTQQINEATIQCTYPSGFGSTANSLTVVKSDMTVPAGLAAAMSA